MLSVIFLGTGTSHGVPMIGCRCAVCRSDDPRDKRWRSSIYLRYAGAGVLVDTTPDLRSQALTFGVERVDAILYTHSHADHIYGFSEIRRFNDLRSGAAVPCYANQPTLEDLKTGFSYAFEPHTPVGGGAPKADLHVIDGELELFGRPVTPVPIWHGARLILGYRVGRFAYLTDCSRIPDESWPLLEGLDVVVLDALRDRPHPTHFSLSQAMEAASRIGARRTYFTHMCHDLAHAATNARLPRGVELAYDGLTLEVDG